MKTKSVIASILFADIKGSSKVKNDTLKEIIADKFDSIKLHLLNDSNHFFYKSMGDGVLICSYDYVDMADIALKIRDDIKSTNWKKLGFETNLPIRIGIHLQKISLKEEKGFVFDVFGSGVDTAARIEPITEENGVYCSRAFYNFLFQEETNHFKAVPLGMLPLAKDYGEMELYKLLWNHESGNEGEVNKYELIFSGTTMDFAEIPIPKLKVEFTPEQKNSFVTNSFNDIQRYFKTALMVFNDKVPNVEVSFIESLDEKFACKIFYKGQLKCKCKIWVRDRFSPFTNFRSIAYSENYQEMTNDNRFNQWITVDDNTEHVFLNISNMGKFNNRVGFTYNQINSKKAAEVLWITFIRPFEQM
ncbi:MAG: adenylate/guanylate cyclase domain-containing protein [bacterium]